MKRERDYTLDIIRIFATFSVISVHFFLNNGFYSENIIGRRMYAMIIMRNFFMICVPLFLLLTGYLMGTKKLEKKYFLGIRKTLCIYLLASIACILYKKYAEITDYDLKHAFFAILDFTGASYSWYIEMYIGLFLLIPFINLIFQNINQKQRKLLIIVMTFLTVLPTFTNIYNFDVEHWWQTPALDNNYQKILPSYWGPLWPFTFYFIGCYLKEHPLRLHWTPAFLLAVLITMATGTFNFYRSHGSAFVYGPWQNWNGLLNVILTTLIFHCLLQFKCVNHMPDAPKRVLKIVSDLTLGAYLTSYIFDQIFYKILNNKISSVPNKLEYYFCIVPIIFVCSILLSFLLNMVYYIIQWTAEQRKRGFTHLHKK